MKKCLLFVSFILIATLSGCLTYDKEILTISLNPTNGSGTLTLYVENIHSDADTDVKRKAEMDELNQDHKRRKYRKEWKKKGFRSVTSKLIHKKDKLDGHISGEFRSLVLMAWRGEMIKHFSIDGTTYKIDFGDSHANSEMHLKSKVKIKSSNASEKAKDRHHHTWHFQPKQKRILVIDFDNDEDASK